jgi:hypothetical protein
MMRQERAPLTNAACAACYRPRYRDMGRRRSHLLRHRLVGVNRGQFPRGGTGIPLANNASTAHGSEPTSHGLGGMQTDIKMWLASSRAQGAARTRNVLVVEPHASMRRTLCMCIVEFGYVALDAATADDAMVIASSNPVDLVILDYDRSEDKARMFLQKLRAKAPGFPVVLLREFTGLMPDLPLNSLLLFRSLTLNSLETSIESMLRERPLAS